MGEVATTVNPASALDVPNDNLKLASFTAECFFRAPSNIGTQTMSTLLHHVLWETDREGLVERMNKYLSIASEHGISTIFVFLDDCWNESYAPGPQPEPKKGVHNSGWVKDPGILYFGPCGSGCDYAADTTAIVNVLEDYVTDILTTFRDDDRILMSDFYKTMRAIGRDYIVNNPVEYGSISHRPTDRRENFVKRCVGLPGQTLQIKNRIIYLDGKPNKEPDNVQYSYYVKLKANIPDDVLKMLDISQEDLTSLNQNRFMPLTKRAVRYLKGRKDLVASIQLNTDAQPGGLYPLDAWTGWTVDNYGPIWIPKKGATVKLNMKNIAIYERPIRVYEGNDLVVKNNHIYINGKEAHSYTFKLDYYWMMGDNRHNSADSRFWGFVPEDHIVGKPIFIWWSSDPDRKGFSGVRWSRLFKWVDNIK